MPRKPKMIAHAFSLAFVIACWPHGSFYPQQHTAAPSPRVPVTIALVDQLPQGGGEFVILRSPDRDPHDIILLKTGATSRELSRAVRTLLTVRRLHGDTSAVHTTIRIRPQHAQLRTPPPPPLPWAARVVADLRASTPHGLAGIGRARAVQIWLPPQRRRRP